MGVAGGAGRTSSGEYMRTTKQAKAVFKALDGIYVAVQKKDAGTARLYFDKYAKAMPELIALLS